MQRKAKELVSDFENEFFIHFLRYDLFHFSEK